MRTAVFAHRSLLPSTATTESRRPVAGFESHPLLLSFFGHVHVHMALEPANLEIRPLEIAGRPEAQSVRGPAMSRRRARVISSMSIATCAGSLLLTGCAASQSPTYNAQAEARQIADAVAAGLPSPKITVLAALPHPTDAWTEGLDVSDGRLYEGTGRVGHSLLRELDLTTGRPLRSSPLPSGLDGAGITVTGSLIWQLTSHNGLALQWDQDRLTAGGRVPWNGAGAGLCHTRDGRLVASDGSDELRVIDSNGTRQVDAIPVSVQGFPLYGLNALTCGPTAIWANVADTDWIVAVDPNNGDVTAAVDASTLVPAGSRYQPRCDAQRNRRDP